MHFYIVYLHLLKALTAEGCTMINIIQSNSNIIKVMIIHIRSENLAYNA